MESSSDNKKRKELEDRLKQAFPQKWYALSEDKKVKVINKFFRLVWVDRIPPKETLSIVRSKGLNFGMIFVGAILALFIGLLVNIIHESLFEEYKVSYTFAVVGTVSFLIWKLNRLFEESINDEYREGRFFDELLREKGTDEK